MNETYNRWGFLPLLLEIFEDPIVGFFITVLAIFFIVAVFSFFIKKFLSDKWYERFILLLLILVVLFVLGFILLNFRNIVSIILTLSVFAISLILCCAIAYPITKFWEKYVEKDEKLDYDWIQFGFVIWLLAWSTYATISSV